MPRAATDEMGTRRSLVGSHQTVQAGEVRMVLALAKDRCDGDQPSAVTKTAQSE